MMLKTSRYVTLCFAGITLGASGCGSTQKICPPVVAPKVMTNVTSDGSAKTRVDLGGNAGTNAAADAAATARAKVAPTEAELREAADLRARAQGHVDAGRWREALPDLERAFSLSGDVTMLGDLGLALHAAGRFDEAWLALYRFRAEARASYEPIRAKIDAKLGELEKQLGGLVIDTDTPGAELIVRGQVVAKLPLATPIFLAPGDVSVIVRAAGKPDFTLRSRVAIGAVARASANLGAVAAVGVGTVGDVGGALGRPTGAVGGALGGVGGTLGGVGGALGRPSGGVKQPAGTVGAVGGVGAFTPPVPTPAPILPIVIITGGVVVLGGALAAGVIYSGKAEQFDLNHCGKADAKPICKSLDSDANVSMLKVTGGLLGGALVTGIVAYLIVRPKAPDLDCPQVGKAAPLRLRCGAGADNNGAGIACVGAF